MRNFNKREKAIIKRIVEYDFDDLKTMSLFMQEVYFKNIQDGAIVTHQAINLQLQAVYFPKGDIVAFRNILEAILLFQYLFEVRYLSKIALESIPIVSIMSSATKGEQHSHINVKFPNGEYIDSEGIWYNKNNEVKYECRKQRKNNFNIIDTVCCGVFVSEDLKELVNNDFQTLEQIRFNDQMKDAQTKHTEAMAKANRQINIGWIAATLSFIGLLIAIILPFCTKTSLSEKKEIIKAIESTKIEIPESINSVITNDNLEVSIINKQLDVNVKNRQFNTNITNDTLNVKTTIR